MDLILWRHAEAEDGLPDQSRKLTAKGEKQASQMAAWLRERLPKETRVIVSPAKRTQQTAQALSGKFETLKEVGVGASVPSLLAAAGWPDAKGAVLVVGHQPTLGQVAALLLGGEEASWTIRKGAVWWLSSRVRQDETQVVLRTVMAPDML
ncbi:histidine phosphatase family protein [Sulfurimicrobium lacus]|uniref:Histidine phosphatase family protein n=1 Tax=Sulfurimicrobium lacus TaxID=2715678 RepID=A0A6F8VCU1_9PROT|nr:histidine phosphatase family protein [Sulfurimicrobium lacus]BCB27538.1 histidine phosphatase family protein [Sulfurimicrobium lacus]